MKQIRKQLAALLLAVALAAACAAPAFAAATAASIELTRKGSITVSACTTPTTMCPCAAAS